MNRGIHYQGGRLVERGINFLQKPASFYSSGFDKSTFISYQSDDRDEAVRIAGVIGSTGHECYIDAFDPSVDGDGPELEEYLRDVIGRCGSLLAVVSRTTKSSWWVPLEIGVALHERKYIATYRFTTDQLPSYLWLRPVLTDDRDLLTWVRDIQKKTVVTMNREWNQRSRLAKEQYVRA